MPARGARHHQLFLRRPGMSRNTSIACVREARCAGPKAPSTQVTTPRATETSQARIDGGRAGASKPGAAIWLNAGTTT